MLCCQGVGTAGWQCPPILGNFACWLLGYQDHSLLLTPQDYVKWRGHLFHQFLRALVDESARVRSLAEYLLTDTLSSKVGNICHVCHF